MKTFSDVNGKEWRVEVNVNTVRRVRDTLAVNLASSSMGGVVESIGDDPILLCDLLYVICRPQADADGITDEQFGQAMAGDAIAHATTAFLEALAAFFPSPRRAVLERLLAEMATARTTVLEAATRRLESGVIGKAVDAEMAKADLQLETLTGGRESGTSPESSDSTPALTP